MTRRQLLVLVKLADHNHGGAGIDDHDTHALRRLGLASFDPILPNKPPSKTNGMWHITDRGRRHIEDCLQPRNIVERISTLGMTQP